MYLCTHLLHMSIDVCDHQLNEEDKWLHFLAHVLGVCGPSRIPPGRLVLSICDEEGKCCENQTKQCCQFVQNVLQVMDFLGSAAFSKAVQALDTKTGMLVCLKIIKVTISWCSTSHLKHMPES